jgi:hypothetical protein
MSFWLIENKEQLDYFQSKNYKKVFIELILGNNNYHPTLNNLSLIYIRPLSAHKGYMVAISHSETLSCNITHIDALLRTYDEVYVRDKKNYMYFFQLKSVLDINFIEKTPDENLPFVFNHFYNLYSDNKDINKIIPVVKHYERCEELYKIVKPIIDKPLPNHFNFYNKNLTNIFWFIEQEGLKIDKDLLHNLNLHNSNYSIDDSKIYSKYNLYNITGRPSNSFNGLNFLSLNKKTGQRKTIIPDNDYLLEIDISAYHPTLASQLIEYNFYKNPYELLSEELNMGVGEAKLKMFEVIYGGNFKGLENIEFFSKLKKFIESLWEEFNKVGYVEESISGFRFYKKDFNKEMNKYKLFNYLLQCKETAQNVVILKKIITLLKDKESKIILYTYDSFCLDMKKEENNIINDILDIFKNFKLNTKIKEGVNYDF